MWRLAVSIYKSIRRTKVFKMNRVSRDAPVGMQFIQWLSGKLCPRLRINRLKWHRAGVLLLTYVTYMTYHLTRKPISVVKSVLHQNCSALPPPSGPHDEYWCDWPPFNTSEANTLLGVLDSAFLFSYAAAMFVSGMVAERVDLRYFLTFGMLFSSIFCYLFGLAHTYSIHHISYYIFVQIGAGISQTSGWPATVAIVSKWFGNAKKGLIFGIWNSHTSLGNILGTLLAAQYVESDWALSFVYPALVMACASLAVCALLVPDPAALDIHLHSSDHSRSSDDDDETDGDEVSEEESRVLVGDQAANLRTSRHSANNAQREEDNEQTSLLGRPQAAISFSRALAIPGVIPYSISLFFAKLVSYTFLYWLPVYINSSTSLSARSSGELSTVFDAGAVGGAVLAGSLADRAPAALVCIAFYALTAPALFAYRWWGARSFVSQCALLAAAGALVNGPYALITTAVSAELGGGGSGGGSGGSVRALATVAALVDGAGSLGAALGPLLAGLLSAASWDSVFYMLVACDLLALLVLLRTGMKELSKLRQQRRMASPPRVRIH